MIKLSSNSERAFRQAVQFMAKQTRFEPRGILERAAVSYIRAGRNVTPKARKNKKRKVERIPGGTGRGGWPKFGITVLSQKKPPQVVPVTIRRTAGGPIKTIADVKRNVRMARVPHIMAGKNSWFGVFRSLGKGMNEGDGHKLRDVAHGDFRSSGWNSKYTIFNDLVYLLKIAPEVDKEGRRRAAKDIAIKTENMVMKSWGTFK